MSHRDETAPFQVMPELSPDEYAALRDDIRANGQRQPIDVDQHGRILDGHHRADVCAELGIEPLVRVVQVDDDTAARAYAFSVNTMRRHLSREQRRTIVVRSVLTDPTLSDRQHAARCGVSPSTVGLVREGLVASGQLSNLDSRQGADGRQRRIPAAPAEPRWPEMTPGVELLGQQEERIRQGRDAIREDFAYLRRSLRAGGATGREVAATMRAVLAQALDGLGEWPEPRDEADHGPSAADLICSWVEPLIEAVEVGR